MKIYTDCPDQLHGFFPEPPGWRLIDREHLDEADAPLWQALQGAPTLWRAERPLSGLSRLVIVARAPGSQYDAMLKLLKQGHRLPDGTAALALEGDGFHGRGNRPWQALRGNLHLSIYQRMQAPVQHMAAGLSMLPAVAAVEAIRAACGPDCGAGIKWVNDIVMQGGKVAGVLTATQSRGAHLEHAVCGIGLNVENTPELLPTPFVPRAGCLRTKGPDPDIALPTVFWKLLQVWQARFRELADQGPGPVLAAYRKHAIILGQPVRIWDEDVTDHPERLRHTPPLAQGTVLSIESDLGLKIRGMPGIVRRGRLALEAACQAYGL